jgi:hypothetical protein
MAGVILSFRGRSLHLVSWRDRLEFCPYHSTHVAVEPQRGWLEEFDKCVRLDHSEKIQLRWLMAEESAYGLTRLSDQDMLQRIGLMLASGRLYAVECRMGMQSRSVEQEAEGATEGDGAAGAGPAEVEQAATAAAGAGGDTAEAAPPPDLKTWIEVELIDEEGLSVAYAKYKIKLPDGSTQDGSLDANGSDRISEIDPGVCEVWFPDFDARDWKKL